MYEEKHIARLLQKEDNFLITSHIRPDGDSISSQLTLFITLQELGKNACIVNPEPVPTIYHFLPYVDKILLFRHHKNKLMNKKFDVVCILDCCEWDRLDSVGEWIKDMKAIKINIDHHLGTGIGDYNYIDTKASATGELIYKIYTVLWQKKISYELALNFYVAIATDTGLFKQVNTTAEAHRITAELIKCGVEVSKINSLLFEDLSSEYLKLIGKVLSTLQTEENDKILFCSLKENLIKERKDIELEPEKIIDELRRVKSAEVILLFREIGNNRIKVSLRSKKQDINIAQVANMFGGGGHPQAAGCILQGTIKTVQKKIIREIKKLFY